MTLLWILILVVVGLMAYVRLSPLDANKGHNPELPTMGPG